MAKQRNDYENSWFPRLIRWLAGGSDRLEKDMVAELEEESHPHDHVINEELLRREQEVEAYRQKMADYENGVYDRMHTWSRTKGVKWMQWLYRIASVAICLSVIAVLLTTVSNLPTFGSGENPINNEVTERYIEKGLQETGAVNIVAGMILDYRAFDTLGESHVLFIAACAVMILLKLSGGDDEISRRERMEAEANDRKFEPKNDLILQKISGIMVPVLLVYGIYVVLNGHISPGGGFSGGAIMGGALILYLNAFGFEKTEKFFTFKTFKWCSFGALAFYAFSKAYSFFCGANHLDSGIGLGNPGDIFSAGLILYLNIAVGLVVCCTMYAFYALFRKGDM